jgi:hypothetical protein
MPAQHLGCVGCDSSAWLAPQEYNGVTSEDLLLQGLVLKLECAALGKSPEDDRDSDVAILRQNVDALSGVALVARATALNCTPEDLDACKERRMVSGGGSSLACRRALGSAPSVDRSADVCREHAALIRLAWACAQYRGVLLERLIENTHFRAFPYQFGLFNDPF